MHTVKPLGINIKDNDRNVPDEYLQESINLQWRDGSVKPIPERLISDIYTDGYENIIFHKVADEDQINVLGFTYIPDQSLSSELSSLLVGDTLMLAWFGTITDGVYAAVPETLLPINKTPGMSFIVLNGLLYFMGDGSSEVEQFYTRLQYNETDDEYEAKDMYKWKTLIPFYPFQSAITSTFPQSLTEPVFPAPTFPITITSDNYLCQCGLICVRFALVLKTGEVVLHSPIYTFLLYGINRTTEDWVDGDLIKNIHTYVNMDLSFADSDLFDEEISAINMYASVPYYETELPGSSDSDALLLDSNTMVAEIQKMAEQPFYLIKTIDKPNTDKILLTVGQFDADITTTEEVSKLDIATIAAGEVMPVDNFSHHRLYGRITSVNGRIVIDKPVTVLGGGHVRSLATQDVPSDIGFRMDTEDGTMNGISSEIDKALEFNDITGLQVRPRGILSYPDSRTTMVGGSNIVDGELRLFKARANTAHNMACAFDISTASFGSYSFGPSLTSLTDVDFITDYNVYFIYDDYDELTPVSQPTTVAKYSSQNRLQFSAIGEFSVWPAANSYRVGDGEIMRIGNNSVNPGDVDVISPIIVGTTEGIYTINLDPTGSVFVSSITKTKNIPYISSEVLQLDGSILFVSDKGLMAINNGDVVNLTYDSFPSQGNGRFQLQENIYPNYNILTETFFGAGGNPYILTDIVDYMRGAIFAFDARRDNIWCSNPDENFSLILNTVTKQWGMSTFVFDYKSEFYSTIDDVYTRFMVKSAGNDNMVILSGEDMDTEVEIHMLSRPMKFRSPNSYKRMSKMFLRCVLERENLGTGYFSFGLWGKQDVNKYKTSIPIVAKTGGVESFPNNVRYDIPISTRKGKYKAITALLTAKVLPDSDIDNFEFDVKLVDDSQIR